MSTVKDNFWLKSVEDQSELISDKLKHANETLVWAEPDEIPPIYGAVVYLILIPIICGVGFITNVLNIIIFARPRLWKAASSSYCYFMCKTILNVFICFNFQIHDYTFSDFLF